MSDFNKQVVTATKWSAITEIAAKLVAPVSTMVLARLLTPDAFGILVTATMVISFVEIFTDAGFQKYLIQHNFVSIFYSHILVEFSVIISYLVGDYLFFREYSHLSW